MMKKKINLNADMGESFGSWVMGSDEAMLAIVNSANLACGFHAGDPLVMLKAIQSAKEHGVSIGAHPSYPDLQGFGRRAMQMSDADLPLEMRRRLQIEHCSVLVKRCIRGD